MKLLSHVQLFATPWTVNYQASLSMGFSRKEYWSGLPFPSPGDLPNQGMEPRSPALQANALPSEPPGICGIQFIFNIQQLLLLFSSVAQSCATLCNPKNHSTPGLTVHCQLLEHTQTHAHRVRDAIQPSHPLLPLLLLPPISPSIRVFSNESALRMRWPKYWSFSFSISPSNEYPRLISFKMDLLDLLAVQGILKSLLQHHSSKASIFRRSGFLIVQLSHPHMTTGKTIALTRRTFVGRVKSLLFNMLSRLVITFLPRGVF